MDLAIIVLGILFLCGLNVGKALAICAIIEGSVIFISSLLKAIRKKLDK